MRRITGVAVALVLATFTACEFGAALPGPEPAIVKAPVENAPVDVDPATHSAADWEAPAGEPWIDEEGPSQSSTPELAAPGFCMDLSSGTPLIVPCLPVDPRTGDTSHGDPQPWKPGTPSPVPQPY